ncbi:hypothetical protein ABWJ95_18820, partial [Rhodococcus baikonurensis]|uniref:hypothetical protein n=1 Tax=Rhodococcus baikonurensis TaxID=172041 RepID=UPI00339755F9
GYMSAIADAIINGGDGKWSWPPAVNKGAQRVIRDLLRTKPEFRRLLTGLFSLLTGRVLRLTWIE